MTLTQVLEQVIQYGTGTYGRYEGNFDFSGPLAPHLLYRLTGVGFSEGSQTWFIHPERYAAAPALTWIPDAKTSLTLLSNYTYNPEVGAYANVPALGSALWNPNGKIAPGFFPGDPNFNLTKQSFIQAGDVFHLKSPSRNSHALVQRTIDTFRSYPV